MPVKSDQPIFIRINDYLRRIDISLEKAGRLILIANDLPDAEDRRIMLESGVGRTLHDVYSGYEKIFEEIAEEVDGGKPVGESWHVKLLTQAKNDAPSRPRLIPDDLAPVFDDLRGFRHVFRSSYGGDLRVDEITEKFERLRKEVRPGMIAQLQVVADYLAGPEDPFSRKDRSDGSDPAGTYEPGEP